MVSASALRLPLLRLPPAALASHLSWRRLFGEEISVAMDASLTPSNATREQPWLFVGLGNPGQKFEGTRHNVGFELIDAISEAEGIKLSMVQHKALIGEGVIAGAPVLLAKPQTYANLSGESVGPLAEHYGVPVQQIVVIFDDMESKVAMLRLLPKGGHGDHQGMKSLIKHLRGSREFPRLRIGIGAPPGKMDPRAYVLQKFCKEERDMMDISIARGVEAVKLVATEGIEKTINSWDQVRKSRVRIREEKDMKIC